jgi:hypothetical protein
LSVALALAGEIYDYTDSVDGVNLPAVDAVVCLAGGRGRIASAGDVWYRYWELAHSPQVGAVARPRVPVLFLSGMGERASLQTVRALVRPGVVPALSPSQVIVETESTNTVENARHFARYARERGWKRVLLITSRYHMRRSRLIFEQVLSRGLPDQIETLSVYQEPFEPGEWREDWHGIRVTLTEYFKWLYYRAVIAQLQPE